MARHGIFLLLFLVIWLGSSLGAETIKATTVHQVIVYLVPEHVPQKAAELAPRLTSTRVEDQTLRAAVGFPTAARAAFDVPPQPDGREPEAGSSRDRLGRYLLLEYPLPVDVEKILDQLHRDERFGFIGHDLAAEWSTTVPNDPHYDSPISPPDPTLQQVYFQQLGLEAAWDYTQGYAILGAGDTGIEVGHEDLLGNLRLHHSWDFRFNDADPTEDGSSRGHGTHVSGILAADTNNSLGVAGTCWGCSLLMSRVNSTMDRIEAFLWMAGNGAQGLSLSGFESTFAGSTPTGGFPPGIPCSTTPPPQQHPFCPMLELLEERDIVFSASSGNDRRRINFPANEPNVIAVGGTDRLDQLWDDLLDPGCPDLNPPHPDWGPHFQCGSNFGPEQDFAAPAKMVLSTFFTGFSHNAAAGCSDNPNNPNTFDPFGSFGPLGYDWCTGTSMSAPFVSAIFGLVRSANPLLSVATAKQAIAETTAQAGSHNDSFGYGIPNTGAAIERVLGNVDGTQRNNRMTPMFSLYSSPVTNYLYTTKPQVASAAVAGTLHELPTSSTVIPYSSAAAGSPIAGYSAFPLEPGIPSPTPRSSFWVFTTDHNPFNPAAPLYPLYRLSFVEDCDPRDHVYTTEQAGIELFTGQGAIPDWCPSQPGNQVFRLDGIEGYIFHECPPGFTCNNPLDPGQPQCLHRRSSQVEDGHALILERELGQPPYQTYTGVIGNSCIGYVFPNDDSDGDGLIDGFERVLGTNPQNAHSDCDGIPDGVEYPIAGLPASDPLDDSECCDSIFADSFDSGTTANWAAANTAGAGVLQVSTGAAMVGPFGLSAAVNGGATDQAFVVDLSPTSETHYRASFFYAHSSSEMGASDSHFIFIGVDDNPSGQVLRIETRRSLVSRAFREFRALARLDNGTWAATSWFQPASPKQVEIEVEWWSTPSLSAGGLRLSFDGVLQQQLTGLINSTAQIDRVRLGVVNGVDPATIGEFFFDEFASCRD